MDTFTIILLLVIVALVFLGVFTVQQQTVAVVERFGKFNRLSSPGLNFLIPIIESKASVLSLRIQQLDVHVETKTHDNVFVKVKVSVQFQIIEDKIYEACYKLFAPAEQIEAFVFDVVRAKVPNIELDDLFAKKDEIANDVKHELEETMQGFGYQIIKALVTDIEPNENVKHAMNEINTALRLRIAANEKAEAEKIIRIKQAEAEAEANILHGKGLAGQRKAIIEGLGNSVGIVQKQSPEMSSKEIMSTILAIQYFDMLREVGASGKTNTLFVTHSPDNASNVKNQMLEAIFAAEGQKLAKK
jgi:regulator of protease activity HflC (stomatin/prohibitin superfamily)